jgi:hypothetical protein
MDLLLNKKTSERQTEREREQQSLLRSNEIFAYLRSMEDWRLRLNDTHGMVCFRAALLFLEARGDCIIPICL